MAYEDWTDKELKDCLESVQRERDHAHNHPGMGSAHTFNYERGLSEDCERLKDEINKRSTDKE